MRLTVSALALAGLVLPLTGCGSGLEEFPVAKASGKVVCEGEPVAGVQVFFEPLGKEGSGSAVVGKTGHAFTEADGTFVLSTYGNLDGAVVGKHRVRIMGPASAPCPCEVGSEAEVMQVDVESGKDNSFEVALKKRAPGAPGGRRGYDPDAEDAARDL